MSADQHMRLELVERLKRGTMRSDRHLLAEGYHAIFNGVGYGVDLRRLCTWCGCPMSEHYLGGYKYHPRERPSLWFWETVQDVV